jgi:integrase
MASAEKLPSKRYRGLYRDSAGEKQRVPGTYRRKSDALEAAQEAEVEARRKAAAATGKLSARTKWGEWWSIFNADRTFDSDNGAVEANLVKVHVMPRWGAVPLNKIEQFDVQAWVDQLAREGRAPNYVRNIVRPFRVSINGALSRRILTASPCAGVKLPRVARKPKVFVSTEQAKQLGARLHERYQDALDFLMETGLRPSELAGLHAHRIDLERGWLEVVDTHVRRKGVIREHPKDGDVRSVPLTTKAIAIVKRRLAGRDLAQGCGIPHSNDEVCTSPLVFLNVRDGVLNCDLLGRHMRTAAKSAGLPKKSGYATRRGFATRAIEGGADVFAVKRVMGHADLEELEGYVQETPAARSNMLAALGERAPLAVVEDRGTRGTGRGTEVDNQTLPTVTREDETNAG